MKIFITGSSGFLGRRVVTRLLKEGHQLTLLVRKPEQMKDNTPQITTVLGDLDYIDRWSQSLANHDALIHLAAPVVFWGKWSLYKHAIVDATLALYRAANRHYIKRFVYISSEAVIQDDVPLLDIDETHPYIVPNSFYGKSKQMAERLLLAENGETECIILRPTFVWGKGVPALKDIVDKVNSGQFMWIDKGQVVIELVHVDNVVEAIRLALTRGENKHIYYVTDDHPRTVREILTTLLATQGVTPPEKSIPNKLARTLAGTIEGVWRLLPIRMAPPISRFEWSFVGLPRRYNIGKIKKDLGYQPVTRWEQGVKEMRDAA